MMIYGIGNQQFPARHLVHLPHVRLRHRKIRRHQHGLLLKESYGRICPMLKSMEIAQIGGSSR